MHTLRRAYPLAQLWYRYDELDAHPIDDEDLDVSVDQQDVRVSEKGRAWRPNRPATAGSSPWATREPPQTAVRSRTRPDLTRTAPDQGVAGRGRFELPVADPGFEPG